MDNFIAIDFETANANMDSVCSLGAVIYKDGKLHKTFYSLINPNQPFDPFNISIHKITPKDTKHAPTFNVAWLNMFPQWEKFPFVAHNATFDQRCLYACCERYQIPFPNNPFYCTYSVAKKLIPHLLNYKLNTVALACGFELKNHHNALADALACAAIAQQII